MNFVCGIVSNEKCCQQQIIYEKANEFKTY